MSTPHKNAILAVALSWLHVVKCGGSSNKVVTVALSRPRARVVAVASVRATGEIAFVLCSRPHLLSLCITADELHKE